MNVENINKLIKWLEADQALHFKIGSWSQYLDKDTRKNPTVIEYEECNTAFCLGGYVDLMIQREAGKTNDQLDVGRKGDDHYTNLGADYLGLSHKQARELFGFENNYISMSTFDSLPHEVRAAVAIHALELLRDGSTNIRANWHKALKAHVTDPKITKSFFN